MTTNKSNDPDDSEYRVVDKRHFASDGSPRDREEVSNRSETAENEPPSAPGVDFGVLVRTLAIPALAALGQVPGPEGTPVERDLDAARQFIDLMGILEEKTKGNLSKDETDLLEQTLFSLRLAVVEGSKAGS